MKDLFRGMNKALAYQVAKKIPKEDFLRQLDDTWLALFAQSSGAIDVDSQLNSMRTRIKKSGYEKAFKNAGITDEDLGASLKRAIEASGRST